MKYVCTGATLKCTMGTSCPKLIATPKNVSLTGKNQANVADYVSMKNVPSFGRCRSLGYPPTASATTANHGKLTPMPCVPGTCPKWQVVDKDSLICGEPALLEPATLRCVYGGTISIVNPGQSLEIKVRSASFSQKSKMQQEEAMQEIPEELLQEFNALDREGLTQQSVLDGVQMVLDVAGMAPGVGAVPDLLNAAISVMRGDWLEAGLSVVAAVPGVGDVVGGAKIAYRGAKIATKSANATKNARLVGIAKAPSKETKSIMNSSTSSSRDSVGTGKSINIESDSISEKEKQQLRKLRAKRAGVNPEECYSEILYDSIPEESKQSSRFLELTLKNKIHSTSTRGEIPKFEIDYDELNILEPSKNIKPIRTNTTKDYELTKKAMENAENKEMGNILDLEG